MASNTDVAKPLLTWLFGGIGALLVYSAFRTQSPLDVLRGVQDTGKEKFITRTPAYSEEDYPNVPGRNNAPGGVARLRMIATREIPPSLVSIPSGGQLDVDAARSLARISSRVGYSVPNVGAYRSYATQAALYASNPNRFGSPQTSLHVVGLAIDVAANKVSDPNLVAAFVAEGWHRARAAGHPGYCGSTGKADELWHWSYGVCG